MSILQYVVCTNVSRWKCVCSTPWECITVTVVLRCVPWHSLCPGEQVCVNVNVPDYVTQGVQSMYTVCLFLQSHFVIHGNKGQGKTMWLSDLLLG